MRKYFVTQLTWRHLAPKIIITNLMPFVVLFTMRTYEAAPLAAPKHRRSRLHLLSTGVLSSGMLGLGAPRRIFVCCS